jgi:NHL repeat-containing protein
MPSPDSWLVLSLAAATLAALAAPIAGRRVARGKGNCAHLKQACSAAHHCCSGGLVCAGGSCQPAADYTLVGLWGSEGKGDGQIDVGKTGLAVGSNLDVADSFNSRVVKFSRTGAFLENWGAHGSGKDQFGFPTGIALDGHGHVYVADYDNRRNQKFTTDGKHLTQWVNRPRGLPWFLGPIDVAVGDSSHVYVLDIKDAFGEDWPTILRVQKFTSDGKLVKTWGQHGDQPGQYNYSMGIAVDANEQVFVADNRNLCVQVFDSDGTFVRLIGTGGAVRISSPVPKTWRSTSGASSTSWIGSESLGFLRAGPSSAAGAIGQ